MGKQEEDRVLLREVECGQRGAVTFSELRPPSEEERDVGAEPGGDVVQPLVGQAEGRVRGHECRSGIGASPAEPRRDGNLLVDPDPPARLDSRSLGHQLQCALDERVVLEALDAQTGRRLELERVGESDALEHRRHLVLAVPARPGRRRARG